MPKEHILRIIDADLDEMRMDSEDRDRIHVWVASISWDPRRAFYTGGSPFARALDIPKSHYSHAQVSRLIGKRFMAVMDDPPAQAEPGERIVFEHLRPLAGAIGPAPMGMARFEHIQRLVRARFAGGGEEYRAYEMDVQYRMQVDLLTHVLARLDQVMIQRLSGGELEMLINQLLDVDQPSLIGLSSMQDVRLRAASHAEQMRYLQDATVDFPRPVPSLRPETDG